MQDDGCYTNNFDAILKAEAAHIEGGEDAVKDKERLGLAFSGGGIRSASFALGLMQALVSKDHLKKFDYLSTVSGGGYIGSALTWFLNQKIPSWMGGENNANKDQYFSTSPDKFPFGQKSRGNRQIDIERKPNAILDFIRQHGNYLIPGKGLGAMALIGYVLRALIVSLTVYTALLTAFMVGFYDWGFYSPVPAHLIPFADAYIGANWFFYSAFLLFAIFIIASFLYSLFTRFNIGRPTWIYEACTLVQRYTGWMLSISLLLCIIGSVRIVHEMIGQHGYLMRMSAAGGSTILGVIGALSQYKSIGGGSKLNANYLVLASMFLIYGVVLMAYFFGEHIVLSSEPTWWLTSIMIAVMLLLSTCVNINFLGLHRMYRDRLMETFLPNVDAVKKNTWELATEADTTSLDTLCQVNRRPYHLINTNIVLVDSRQSKYRGRGGDSFTLSPLFCGSDATGWCQSKRYMHHAGRKGMTLPTAMAISGAAVNPNAAVDGNGTTRNRIVSTLLALLNLRLGFWAPNPNPKKFLSIPPNFISPGLKGGVLGGGLQEDRLAVELSDGGHFENLGIYELVRRKLKVIVASDAGADPNFNFSDLANAVEKVRVDFGATIVFNHPDYVLEDLLPGSEQDDYFVSKYQGAKRPFAIASIYYNDGSEGLLVYVKTTLVKGLPADLLGYKTANPSFPDQSTADQFFDERQFEAYRELGYCLGKILLDNNEEKNWF